MTQELKKQTLTLIDKDEASGYGVELYILAKNIQIPAPDERIVEESRRSLVMELSCPPEHNIDTFIVSLQKMRDNNLSAEEIDVIRKSRTYSIVLMNPKSTDRKKIFLPFDELQNADIMLSEATQERLTYGAAIANMDPAIPLKGGAFNAQNNAGKAWLERQLYPDAQAAHR